MLPLLLSFLSCSRCRYLHSYVQMTSCCPSYFNSVAIDGQRFPPHYKAANWLPPAPLHLILNSDLHLDVKYHNISGSVYEQQNCFMSPEVGYSTWFVFGLWLLLREGQMLPMSLLNLLGSRFWSLHSYVVIDNGIRPVVVSVIVVSSKLLQDKRQGKGQVKACSGQGDGQDRHRRSWHIDRCLARHAHTQPSHPHAHTHSRLSP